MTTQPSTKSKTKLKGLLVLLVVVAAAAIAGAYYSLMVPHAPPQFNMTVNPPSFHAAAGGGFLLFIQVSRVSGFTADVNITLLNPPSWISPPTVVLNSTSTNGTMVVPLSSQAVKGSYELTVDASAQGSADQTATVSLKVVGVTQLVSSNGAAVVYDTTKTLDSATLQALIGYNNGTFQFSQSTPLLDGLQPGDVIAASFNQTSILPHGFLRTVLDVHQQSTGVLVDTREAALTEAAQDITFGAGGSGTGASGTSVSSFGFHPLTSAADACNSLDCIQLYNQAWQPLGGSGIPLGGSANLYIGENLGIYLGGGGHISFSGIDWMVLGLFGHEEASAIIKGKAGDQFNWANNDLATLYAKDIGIIPPILNIHIELDLAGNAYGTLLENVNTGIDQTYDLVLAVTDNVNSAPSAVQTYCQGGGWSLCAKSVPSFTHNMTITPPPNPGTGCKSGPNISGLFGGGLNDACPRISIGPRLSVGIDGTIYIASISGSAYLETDAFLELDTQAQGAPVWTLYAGIGGFAGVAISAGFNYPCGGGCDIHGCWISTCYASAFSYSPQPWDLGDWVRQDIWDAPNLPPPNPVLIIANSATTVDLSNPGGIHGNVPLTGWGATMGAEPEGEPVTCNWLTNELGQIATTQATGSSLLACPGPSDSDFYALYNKIVSMGLTKLTITVVAQDSANMKSAPSNAVTVRVVFPTPILFIESPQNSTTVTEGTPINAFGRATLATVTSNQYPNGIIDLCQSEPQNLFWYVGGNFEADIVDVGEGGWVGAAAWGSGCNPTNPPITIPPSGKTSPYQTTIYFVLAAVDPKSGNSYIPENIDGTPVSGNIVVATVTVQPTTPPPSGVTTTSANKPIPQITSPSAGSSFSVGQSVPLQGTVSGGAPPYTTATWTAQSPSGSYPITSGPASSTLNYKWAFGPNVGCTQLGIYNTGTVDITLSVSDSGGQTGYSNAVAITLNCVVTQTIQPMPLSAVINLLAVAFAVTGERFRLRSRTVPRLALK